jgi:hypothetical protein
MVARPRFPRRLARRLVGLLALVPGLTHAQAGRAVSHPDSARADTARALAGVRIEGRTGDLTGLATSASEGRIGRADLARRPRTREGELLEAVPGLIVTQHSGDGKANQLFVRGFNLDHGTDFSTRVDGVPLNSPTHAHGQGYTDLNWIIPEAVEGIDYRLGVQHAATGDFGSAGSADLHLVERIARPFATVEAGPYAYARLVTGGSTALGAGTLTAMGELKGYDGPWLRPEGLAKRSALVRYGWGAPTSRWRLTATSYANRWSASDQIPLRAVSAGQLSPFGQVDSTLGGATERHALSLAWRGVGAAAVTEAQAWLVQSALDLTSNFTYGLDDPAAGDQFNQREHRTTAGLRVTRASSWATGAVTHQLTLGLEGRTDWVRGLGLYRTRARQRVATIREDDVTQLGAGAWAEVESRWTPALRTTLGLRADGTAFDVASDDPRNAGRAHALLASPKASVAWRASEALELYAGAGFGLHSNDARGATIRMDPATGQPASPVTPLVRSRGGELGLRLFTPRGLHVTVAAWALDLDSELLFSGDGGTTEAAPGSARAGLTIATAWRVSNLVSFDLDVSAARARYRGVAPDSQHVPGALEQVAAAGLALGRAQGGPFGALRLRHFAGYPLEETNAVRAQPSTLLHAEAGWQFAHVRVTASLLNVLDAAARDIQYFYASRLPGESAAGVGDIHFHPAEPRQLRVAVRWER